MKRTKLTTEELAQLTELLDGQITELNSKYQSYLQEITAKPMQKDLKMAEVAKAWEELKNKIEDVKFGMHECMDSFHNMNRATRRQLMASYNEAMVNCHDFYQAAVDSCKKGVEIVAEAPGKLVNKAKEGLDKVKEDIKSKISVINDKIDVFKNTVKTKVHEAFAIAKFSLMDFTANRIAFLATTLDRIYDNTQKKIEFMLQQKDDVFALGKDNLQTVEAINKQVESIRNLQVSALRHGFGNLASDQAFLHASVAMQKLSPAYRIGKRTKQIINYLDNKITSLEKKGDKLANLRDSLMTKAKSIKEVIAERA